MLTLLRVLDEEGVHVDGLLCPDDLIGNGKIERVEQEVTFEQFFDDRFLFGEFIVIEIDRETLHAGILVNKITLQKRRTLH